MRWIGGGISVAETHEGPFAIRQEVHPSQYPRELGLTIKLSALSGWESSEAQLTRRAPLSALFNEFPRCSSGDRTG